jgi:uncharacterized lipoprotein YddW (UPF0748 family)
MRRWLAMAGIALLPMGAANAPLPEGGPALVDVSVPREFRGLWVATVSNLDFPSRPGLPPDALRGELSRLVDTAADLGFNALVFQVRAEADAQYDSSFEPWSRVLTGEPGAHPGVDPLAELITLAHARGLEVHAWFNPYRASTRRGGDAHPTHVSQWAASEARPWGNLLWLDPGAPFARELTVAVVEDVVTRYDVDGVHMDDYFYPYPLAGQSFPDDASYAAYQEDGGDLDRPAWRRQNVDGLVADIAASVRRLRPEVRFGISPFGIYRPGIPEGIRGLDQVATLNADPLRWYVEGWVDYLAPQLYWPTTKQEQRYDRLLGWWDQQSEPSRPLVVGLDVTRVGSDPAWTLDEIRTQVTLSRGSEHPGGQIWFRAAPVLADRAGLAGLARELYAEPALPPALPRLDGWVPPPTVEAGEGRLTLVAPDGLSTRAFVLYRRDGDRYVAARVVPPVAASIDVEPGSYAVSVVARHGAESDAVAVDVGVQP